MHRVLFTSPHISSYSFCLLAGFLAGFLVARRNATAAGVATRHIENITLLLVVTGVAGARIFSWLFYFPPGIGFWKGMTYPGGGLVFYGGVAFGALTVVLYGLFAHIPFRKLADIFAASLALGLAFGRIGCFMAGCCWGDICSDRESLTPLRDAKRYQVQTWPLVSERGFPLAVRFPEDTGALNQHQELRLLPATATRSLPVHPVQLYEAILAFFLAWLLQRRSNGQFGSGQLFARLCVGYGVIRLATEFLRADNSPNYWGLTLSQVISLVAIAAFAPIIFRFNKAAPAQCVLAPRPVDGTEVR